MAVDQLIPARRFKQRHHHDRHLLTVRGERREQPALALRPTQAQVLVLHVDLVKLKFHRNKSGRRARPVVQTRDEDLLFGTRVNRLARDTLAPQMAPSARALWSYEERPARDKGGFLSPLVSTLSILTKQGLKIPTQACA